MWTPLKSESAELTLQYINHYSESQSLSNGFLQSRMIRIALAILVLGSALAHPFNLDFAQLDAQMKQLEQLSGKLSPYNHLKLSPYTAAAAKQPQFSAHFSPQSLQFSFGQHSTDQQQYSTAQQQQQQQYNPQDYLADPLGSFPVQ